MTKKIIDRYHSLPVQAKAAVWFFVCSVLQKGISTFTTPLFTRLLTPAEYGEWAVFNSWESIVSIVVTLNIFYGGYTQGLVKFSHDRKVYSSSMQGLTLAMVALWTVVYFMFREFWNELFMMTTFRMSAMMTVVWSSAVFNFWAAEQRVLYRYRTLVAVTIAMSVLLPAVQVAFIFLLPIGKVDARIVGMAITGLSVYTFLFVSQLRRGRKLYSPFYWRYALAFNIPLIFHYLSQMVLGSSDRIMIERMVGECEAGIYSLAYTVSLAMVLLNTTFRRSILPWMLEKIKVGHLRDMNGVIHVSSAVIAVANLVLIGFAPEIVSLFAPPEYHEAVRIVPPVAMSAFFIYLYDMFSTVSFYHEKTLLMSVSSIIGAVLNIVLNIVFIPVFGYIAAGYTTLICYMVYAAFHYMLMRSMCRRFYGGDMPCRPGFMMPMTLAFMLCGFLFLSVYGHTALRFALLAAMAATVLWKRKEAADFLRACMSRKNDSNLS